jgi:hypothetical protein
MRALLPQLNLKEEKKPLFVVVFCLSEASYLFPARDAGKFFAVCAALRLFNNRGSGVVEQRLISSHSSL